MNQTSLPEESNASAGAAPGATEIKVGDGGDIAAETSAERTSARKDRIVDEAQKLKDRAGEKASEYAAVGKEKASEALESLSRLLRDAAGSVDERLGENYGNYARKTADAIASTATSLRETDLAEVADNTREFVRRSPVMAVGAAAAVGFVLARLMKSGSSGSNDAGV